MTSIKRNCVNRKGKGNGEENATGRKELFQAIREGGIFEAYHVATPIAIVTWPSVQRLVDPHAKTLQAPSPFLKSPDA